MPNAPTPVSLTTPPPACHGSPVSLNSRDRANLLSANLHSANVRPKNKMALRTCALRKFVTALLRKSAPNSDDSATAQRKFASRPQPLVAHIVVRTRLCKRRSLASVARVGRGWRCHSPRIVLSNCL